MTQPDALTIAGADWPEFGLVDDVRPAMAAARARGRPAALATLYNAEGGAPRGIGAQMLITHDDVSGYVSGGCVEADIVHHAMAVLDSGAPCRLVYGRGGPLDIRLPCGGRIELLIERLAPDDEAVGNLLALTERRQPGLWLSDGTSRAVLTERECPQDLPPSLAEALVRFQCGSHGNSSAFHRLYQPVQRLVVLGADPTSLAIARMGAQMGQDVVLVRPIGPEAPPMVDGLTYSRDRAAHALEEIAPDRWAAIVVAMHDDVGEHDALMAALPSNAFYVGLLGSRRRLADKLERLTRDGIPENLISRLHAPIGLPIGGSSPWNIALSVLAEITQEAHSAQQRIWPKVDEQAA
ncbi:XdhC family protein [Terrihabitans sp. B22-R8]|uniref:XdhC family protein n=1 Tax=Terrihabitans sp. B22-R8 TaxID=3425128 RepID=UPI00403C2107